MRRICTPSSAPRASASGRTSGCRRSGSRQTASRVSRSRSTSRTRGSMQLERRIMREVEGGNDKWLMRILRHETGPRHRHGVRACGGARPGAQCSARPRAATRLTIRRGPASRRLRAAPGSLVRAEPSDRGLRRDIRGVAAAALALAQPVRGLAGAGEARVRGSTMRDLEGRRAVRLVARRDRAAGGQSPHAAPALPAQAGALRGRHARWPTIGAWCGYSAVGEQHRARLAASRFLREVRPQLRRLLVRRARMHPYLVDHVLRTAIQRARELEPARSAQPARVETRGAGDARAHHARHVAAGPREFRAMKKLRVLVLVHETLVPARQPRRAIPSSEIDEWRTEYDVTTSLRKSGHEVRVLGMGDNLADLRTAITDWKPDIAFNLLEEFQGIVTYDQYVVAFLELMRQPYTGCNPRGMMISRDKALSKQILAYHRIPDAAVRARAAQPAIPRAAAAQVSAVRQVGDRGRLARHLAGVDRARRREAQGARRIHPRADELRRAGRGVHRGPRDLHRRARQRAPDDFSALGARTSARCRT